MILPSPPILQTTSKALNNWLRSHVNQASILLLLAIGAGMFNGLLLVIEAWLIALTINDIVIYGLGLHQVWYWLLSLLAVFVGRAFFIGLKDTMAFEVSARIRFKLRRQLYTHIQALGPAWSSQQRSGDIATSLLDGVEALDKYYSAYLPQIALAVFIPLAILVFVLPTDWVSGLIMIITAPLIPFFMLLIGKGAEQLNQRQWKKLARMSAHFFDVIEGLTTLKLFNASRFEARVIAEVSDEYRRNTMSVLRVAFLSSLVLEFLTSLSIAMVAVFIGFRLLYGEMHYQSGLFVLLLAPEFYLPLRTMGTQYHARMEAIAGAENIVKILDKPLPAVQDGSHKIAGNIPLDIHFENVGFGYEPGHPVLANINLNLRQGQRIALIGPSGAGKTTLSQLLLGFIHPQQGRITINGVDLCKFDKDIWLSEIAWLPQRPTLFHGTLLDNIRLGCPGINLDAVCEAARMANADNFINRLPLGYDTLVGDQGQGLSGGEIQRIALARAFLKNARLVILDEATASLDPESEALITDAVERLALNRTMLVVTHRLATIRHSDHIVLLEDGHIIDQGSHAQLLDTSGIYAKMTALYSGGSV